MEHKEEIQIIFHNFMGMLISSLRNNNNKINIIDFGAKSVYNINIALKTIREKKEPKK